MLLLLPATTNAPHTLGMGDSYEDGSPNQAVGLRSCGLPAYRTYARHVTALAGIFVSSWIVSPGSRLWPSVGHCSQTVPLSYIYPITRHESQAALFFFRLLLSLDAISTDAASRMADFPTSIA